MNWRQSFGRISGDHGETLLSRQVDQARQHNFTVCRSRHRAHEEMPKSDMLK